MSASAKAVGPRVSRVDEITKKPEKLSPENVIDAIRAGASFEEDVPLTRVEWAIQRENQFASVDDDPSRDLDSTRTVEVSWEISEDRTYSSFQISGSAFSRRGGGHTPQGGYNFGEVAIEDLIALRDGVDDVLERVIAGGLYVTPVNQSEAWERYRARRGIAEPVAALDAPAVEPLERELSNATVRRSGGTPWQITCADEDEEGATGPDDGDRSKAERAPARWSMGEASAERIVRGSLRYGNDEADLGPQEEWLHASLTWEDSAVAPETTLFVEFPQLTQWDGVKASDFDAHVNLLVELRNKLFDTPDCTIDRCTHDGEEGRASVARYKAIEASILREQATNGR